MVRLRRACNRRLADACRWWAFNATPNSPGAKTFYLHRRTTGDGHEAALRRLTNKLLGQLHHCLTHRVHYHEQAACGPTRKPVAIHAA